MVTPDNMSATAVIGTKIDAQIAVPRDVEERISQGFRCSGPPIIEHKTMTLLIHLEIATERTLIVS